MNSGIRPKRKQIFWLNTTQDIARSPFVDHLNPSAKADGRRPAARRNDLLQARKRAAAHKQDVRRIYLQELLLGMLAPTLRRHGRDRAFHDFQEGLLNTLARHVARNRRVIRLAADFVDFVDVYDAALGSFDVVVGGLEQLQNNVLDIFADIPRLGQGCRVRHGKRHVENASEGLRKQSLAAACWPDEQNVRFRQFDVGILARVVQPLVVVVDGNG